jgi:hypothetical protein
MPVTLYGCGTWSLILRDEHSLRVPGNRALRRIFGSKGCEVTGCWRKLHNFYSSSNLIKVIKSRAGKLTGLVARMGKQRSAYKALVRKPDVKRRLREP